MFRLMRVGASALVTRHHGPEVLRVDVETRFDIAFLPSKGTRVLPRLWDCAMWREIAVVGRRLRVPASPARCRRFDHADDGLQTQRPHHGHAWRARAHFAKRRSTMRAPIERIRTCRHSEKTCLRARRNSRLLAADPAAPIRAFRSPVANFSEREPARSRGCIASAVQRRRRE